MSTLAEFLLARIAEDEADAKAAVDRHHHPQWVVDGMGICTVGGHDLDSVTEYVRHEEAAPHIARHDPARVLAECESKRRIVEQYERHRDQVMAYRNPRWRDAMNEDDKRNWHQAEARHRVAEDVACLLALPYAEHPDMPKDPSQPEG